MPSRYHPLQHAVDCLIKAADNRTDDIPTIKGIEKDYLIIIKLLIQAGARFEQFNAFPLIKLTVFNLALAHSNIGMLKFLLRDEINRT